MPIRQRVVLAEDHAAVAEQVRILLSAHYDVVAVVNDGEALVATVRQVQPDVIVTDISIPLTSGIAAARIILDETPDARIVVLTVRDEPTIIRNVLRMGVLGYVVKSDAGEELLDAVLASLQGRQYLSANASHAGVERR